MLHVFVSSNQKTRHGTMKQCTSDFCCRNCARWI